VRLLCRIGAHCYHSAGRVVLGTVPIRLCRAGERIYLSPVACCHCQARAYERNSRYGIHLVRADKVTDVAVVQPPPTPPPPERDTLVRLDGKDL